MEQKIAERPAGSTRALASQAEGRGFESRFLLQNTYTLRKAGHFAQPLSFQTTTICFLGRGAALL